LNANNIGKNLGINNANNGNLGLKNGNIGLNNNMVLNNAINNGNNKPLNYVQPPTEDLKLQYAAAK
jgi:hypothetical protein